MPTPAGRARFVGRRRAWPADPAARLKSRRGGDASASEGLPDADIDAERRVVLLRIERNAEVEPGRAEVGVVAHADAGADARRELREIGPVVEIGTAGIDE